eukprot:NODE_5758_length_615_cov_8.506148_g5594_i0.p1 GENE.NODE_5758_length_615_cov_8.506148_g5594_i0~~NODE_5758_length_615_cov_8.506148_g5594_i0.p1  ORF type:complete len:167 (-),score=33.30 NODE_5758_length_615_cov_8.506148_g5594_i0:63-563(-)
MFITITQIFLSVESVTTSATTISSTTTATTTASRGAFTGKVARLVALVAAAATCTATTTTTISTTAIVAAATTISTPSVSTTTAAISTPSAALTTLDIGSSRSSHIGGLGTPAFFSGVEFDLFTLTEAAKAVRFDLRLMDKHIFSAIVWSNKSESLFVNPFSNSAS